MICRTPMQRRQWGQSDGRHDRCIWELLLGGRRGPCRLRHEHVRGVRGFFSRPWCRRRRRAGRCRRFHPHRDHDGISAIRGAGETPRVDKLLKKSTSSNRTSTSRYADHQLFVQRLRFARTSTRIYGVITGNFWSSPTDTAAVTRHCTPAVQETWLHRSPIAPTYRRCPPLLCLSPPLRPLKIILDSCLSCLRGSYLHSTPETHSRQRGTSTVTATATSLWVVQRRERFPRGTPTWSLAGRTYRLEWN